MKISIEIDDWEGVAKQNDEEEMWEAHIFKGNALVTRDNIQADADPEDVFNALRTYIKMGIARNVSEEVK